MKQRCPPGWVRVEFGDVLEDGQNGCGARRGTGKPVVVLRLADVSTDGSIASAGLRLIGLTDEEAAKYALESGDLLAFRVNGSRDITGRVVRYGGPPGLAYCDHFIRFRLKRDIADPQFVARSFESPDVRRQIEQAIVSSAGQNSIAQGSFRGIELDLPPLAEQQRIVMKLEALNVHTQSARASLDAIPDKFERLRQSTLGTAFRGELTTAWRSTQPVGSSIESSSDSDNEDSADPTWVIDAPPAVPVAIGHVRAAAPHGWRWRRMVHVARLESGHTPRKSVPEYWEQGDVPWISLQDIRDAHGRVIHETKFMPTMLGIENSSARLLPAGTVVFSRDISVGFTTIMGRSMSTTQHFANWVCGPEVEPKYLMYALMTAREELLRSGEGTTVKTIYYPALQRFSVLLPSRAEQAQIVVRIENALEGIQRAAELVASARDELRRLGEATLGRAFRGELVAQDPTDEPAQNSIARHYPPDTTSVAAKPVSNRRLRSRHA